MKLLPLFYNNRFPQMIGDSGLSTHFSVWKFHLPICGTDSNWVLVLLNVVGSGVGQDMVQCRGDERSLLSECICVGVYFSWQLVSSSIVWYSVFLAQASILRAGVKARGGRVYLLILITLYNFLHDTKKISHYLK